VLPDLADPDHDHAHAGMSTTRSSRGTAGAAAWSIARTIGFSAVYSLSTTRTPLRRLRGPGRPRAGWVIHVADDWEGSSFRDFVEAIATHRRVIRFDRLGTGCSDRDRASDSFTLDEEVASLEALVDVVAPARITAPNARPASPARSRDPLRTRPGGCRAGARCTVRRARRPGASALHGDGLAVVAAAAQFLGFPPPAAADASVRTKLALPSRSAAAAHAGRAGFD
jgi:hypothetical protein